VKSCREKCMQIVLNKRKKEANDQGAIVGKNVEN
jgi:hypothetical protein